MRKIILCLALCFALIMPASFAEPVLSKTVELDGFTFSVPGTWYYHEIQSDDLSIHCYNRNYLLDYYGGYLYYYTYGFGDSIMVDLFGSSVYDSFFMSAEISNVRREEIKIGRKPACLFNGHLTYSDGTAATVCGLLYFQDYIGLCVFYADINKSVDENMSFIRSLSNSVSYSTTPASTSEVDASEPQSVFYDSNTDLSDLSYDELLLLRSDVESALWASDGWQEVTVPAGVYHIGEDIPAGKWTIRPADSQTAEVYYGAGLKDGGASIDDVYDAVQITSPDDAYAEYNDVASVSWTLEDGSYIKVESSSVVFTPFSGNSFSFK